ncbi:MAG: peptide chain release factor 3 [Acidimicrobiia bacterium]|nr:peptide chain release factor 3 [Acidimicrobiia bacterium]
MPSATSEAARRRTFAIISHPDAGKTTITEKLLLYSGAIEEAGAVKARSGRQKDVTSDWMDMERDRGISITSTALQFQHNDVLLNLLDTPGHRDFSEDTYRVLSAVDGAIIVLDAAKGIEPQTLKLFQVAQARGIPLITFVNKLDRPALSPLELLDDVTEQLGLDTTPMTWPVGAGTEFEGVIDRRDHAFWKFDRTSHGAKVGKEERQTLETGQDPIRDEALQEIELLDAIGADHDQGSFLAAKTTPVFFGSALWNFGIRLLLDAVVDLMPSPTSRPDRGGELRPLDSPTSGFVFKIQANLDPRHRDRIAYMRLTSGEFRRGMNLKNHRNGREFSTKYAHQLFGRDRDTVDVAWPGDIIGLVNATDLKIGDTLSVGGDIEFPSLPTFAPEHFRTAHNLDIGRYKQFRKGISQLAEEGVIQVLRNANRGDQAPILAAVGPMQYDVALHRLQNEFGATVELSPTPYNIARKTDPASAETLTSMRDVEIATRDDGVLLALFYNEHRLDATQRQHPDLLLESVV